MAGSENTEAIVERIELLKVPLDIVPNEAFDAHFSAIFSQIQKEALDNSKDNAGREGKNIVLLSIWDLLRARRRNEYRDFIKKAAVIAPISKSLIGGVHFLRQKTAVRYNPFHFIINLLTVLENHEGSVYFLGGSEKVLKKMENNIRQTFPGLRILGRCDASFRKQDASVIVQAIRKAAPDLLLVGKGVKGEELWIARNHKALNRGLRFWCSDIFEVFAKTKSRPSDAIFDIGFENVILCFRNPLRLFRIFPYLRYKFLLLFYRLFKKN